MKVVVSMAAVVVAMANFTVKRHAQCLDVRVAAGTSTAGFNRSAARAIFLSALSVKPCW